jgi:hypothetical protein
MFLKWCLQASNGRSACIVDGQGFAIAFLGSLSPQNFEGLGAELSLAMLQFRRLDMLAEPLDAALLKYGSSWVTGLRTEADGEPFVLGIISEGALSSDVRTALSNEFVRVLPTLS